MMVNTVWRPHVMVPVAVAETPELISDVSFSLCVISSRLPFAPAQLCFSFPSLKPPDERPLTSAPDEHAGNR